MNAVYFDEEEFGIAPVQLDKRLEFGKKICFEAKEKYQKLLGIDAQYIVCNGEAHDVLTDIAKEKGADLIALGTYGRRGLKRLIMGSVTSSVIVKSPCDVMVLRKTLPCRRFQSLLVPFDGSEFSRRALERASDLAKSNKAQLTILYVIPRYEEMIEFIKSEHIQEKLFSEARKIVAEGEKLAGDHGLSIGSVIEEGHPEGTINNTAKKLGVDLIVMGTYGWKGVNKAIMGSTTERVIMNAAVPVLVVR